MAYPGHYYNLFGGGFQVEAEEEVPYFIEDPIDEDEEPLEWDWEPQVQDEVNVEGAPEEENSEGEVIDPEVPEVINLEEPEVINLEEPEIINLEEPEVIILDDSEVEEEEDPEEEDPVEEDPEEKDPEEEDPEEEDPEEDPEEEEPEEEQEEEEVELPGRKEEQENRNQMEGPQQKRMKGPNCIGGWLHCDSCGLPDHREEDCPDLLQREEEEVREPQPSGDTRRVWQEGMPTPRRMIITIGGPGPVMHMSAFDVQHAIKRLSTMEPIPRTRKRSFY